jgi:3-(3-hydroxy-phenyl)propionate hydroxylase
MKENEPNRVIVVGCGPVGAVMALALTAKEIPVTLLEAESEPAKDGRAATIRPPTVQMLFELGLRDEDFSEAPTGGLPAPIFHFRDRVTGRSCCNGNNTSSSRRW